MLLAACDGNIESNKSPGPLYPQPKTVELNTDGGYILNTVTGDSIKPISTKSGDTLITGVPIPFQGIVIHPDSVPKPKVVKLLEPDSSIWAHQNVHIIPNDLTVITVNKDSLTTILLEEISKGDTSHYKLNNSGDTIPTGIPIPTIGKTVAINLPQAQKALPPGQMDAAITNLQYLDVDQGTQSSYLAAILEDKKGNMWFGGPGGVCRYDGESFTHFTSHQGFKISTVYSLLEDKEGNIWIGTFQHGVIRYDGESFTYFTEKEGLGNTADILLEDKEGNLWFSNGGFGVSRYDGVSFTHFTVKEGLSSNIIHCMMEDKAGNIWMGTPEGVCRFDGKSFTYFTVKEGLSSNNVWSIVEDKSGNIWFGTYDGGVNRYDGKSFTQFTEKEGLSSNMVMSSLEDNAGNLWFGTVGGGVNRYDGKTFTHFTEKEGLSSNNVRDIEEDKAGNLWFGTQGGGVNRYDAGSFSHLTEKEGLPSSVIMSVLEDKAGNLWFGSQMNGVSRYDGESYTNFTEKDGLAGDAVWSMLEDKAGNIWFSSLSGGICRYDGDSITKFTEAHFSKSEENNEGNLNTAIVMSMAEDKAGNIWLATATGISMFNGEFFTYFTVFEDLSFGQVSHILEDKAGNMWFGTVASGVIRYDGESFTYFTEKEGLSFNMVWSLLEDKAGNLWFGTYGGGVSKFNGESFTHFTMKEGLIHNTAFSITEDKSGNIWLGTESGLTKITNSIGDDSRANGDQKHKIVAVNSFGKPDGLKGMDFMINSTCLDSKNRMWWGTGKSLTMLNMDDYSVSIEAPEVYLRQLDINEQYIDFRNITNSLRDEIEFDGVQLFENYPLRLELPYNQNHLTFHFSAIDWNAPNKIKYSYILDGLNTKWSQPTEEGKADYRSLPYGEYKFKVRAIGESNEWSKAFEYEFTIHPPWWHTWWARTLYALGALLIIYLVFRWRIANLKARQKELEHEVDVATIEIREQKDEIEKEKDRSEELLLNILPSEIAEELKAKGKADARDFDLVSILFTDFKGFTETSAKLSAQELVSEINSCFEAFDGIMEKYDIEKIKTIGDAYMAAGGLPVPTDDSAKNTVLAALELQSFIRKHKNENDSVGKPAFEMRVGIHTGPVVAGIVGVKKFQYDIWGDTVNTASRMESNSEVGKVNISQATYALLKNDPAFSFEARGKIEAKGKGAINMWFVSKN